MSFKPVVLEARQRLRSGRELIREQHDSGLPGFQVSVRIADLFDDVVLGIWESSVAEVLSHSKQTPLDLGVALVAHGGFGRRDLAPYSDADLMLLSTRRSATMATKLVGVLTRDLVDAGLDVGLSIRGPVEACRLAWTDPVIMSSLAESRFLAGSLKVYRKFFETFRKGTARRRRWLAKAVVHARREERTKWGETNYLLRPNVKRSRGGLRDIQLIRWLGFIRCAETDLERLFRLGALPAEDLRLIRQSYAFMLRLRNELHFREGRCQDVLDRPTQLEIAKTWGYKPSEGVLAVEHFMQDYFEHTQNVRYASAFFTDDTMTQSLASRTTERLRSRKIDDRIRMGPAQIWVVESELDAFATSLADVLRLMQLANFHSRRISHNTWQAIRRAMMIRQPEPLDEDSIVYFLNMLGSTGRLAPLLRRLHELRVLEQLIPAIRRCRGLLQFNAYHKYTVDAHCIRAVEAATEMEHEPTAMGRRYRRLKDRRILHLALLIHDLGKGYEEDHCDVGKRIAKQTADHLGLDQSASETLQWLIHKHLIVNVAAFRHDLNDSQVVLSFAAEVGSIRRLELLIVHSVADLEAVGPGVATDWKLNLIEDLYLRTRRYFESGTLPDENDPETEKLRDSIAQAMEESGKKPAGQEDVRRMVLQTMPLSMLRRGPVEDLVAELHAIGAWLESGQPCCCVGRHDAPSVTTRYTLWSREESRHIGTFARCTAGLSGLGLQIMRASIETITIDGEDIVWDDFWVIDPDHPGEAPAYRRQKVCQRIETVVSSVDKPLATHRKTWKATQFREPDSVNVLPTKVTFDNETLDQYTILSLFAYDQSGLLARVAQVLADEKIVLHFAKIDTHLDQIADVFYVTEQDGSIIVDVDRQQRVREAILQSIEAD